MFANGRELEPHELPMQRAAAEGIEIWDELLDVVKADGSRITLLMNAKPVRDDRGEVTGAVGVCVDVTRLREAEATLREADRRKDEFLAMLAHELRNPLAAISNGLQLMQVAESDRETASLVEGGHRAAGAAPRPG